MDRQDLSHEDAIYPVELWFYNNPELKQVGLPPFFYLLFFKRQGSGELELYRPGTDGPRALMTGMQSISSDFRRDIEETYNKLWEISPELAHASISFRTDEGDVVQFQAPSFGTLALMDQIAESPFRGVDTSYAERFYAEKGTVEADFLFNFVPSYGVTHVLPGPGNAHYLHWSIELDPQNIALVKDEDQGVYGTLFIITTELVSRDDPDKILLNLRRESFMRLSESEAQTGARRPFSYSGMLPVVPGNYKVNVILRNTACESRDDSSCRKAYTVLDSTIEVPQWDETKADLPPLVLAHGTEHPDEKTAYRPYRFGPLQVLPNPRNVYSIGETLAVMAEPRNAPSGSTLNFKIVNRETPDQTTSEESASLDGFRLEPHVQELSLLGFAGGRYRLVVDLLDETGRVVDTETTDFDVTPRTAVSRPFLRGSWPLIAPEVPGLIEMALGEQYLNLGDKARAKELFETSVEKSPRFGPAREALSSLLLEEGSPGRVIELLEPVLESSSDRFELLALLGEAHFKQKDYTKAAELLEKAMTLRQPEPRLINFLAISQYQMGDPDRALELLERSLALQPDQPEVKELREKIKVG